LTEIGHGSDTKNIETEAIYDHVGRSFILNTPSDAALKFWIGGSGEIATHGVIWAQLIIKGKKYGVHPFIVPLRDRKTMSIYDGVTIGDSGSKIGLHLIDNGYIGFKNYKIPQ
jgi:acyl-CoA oxidase